MPTPYIGFGNDALAKQPRLLAGDEIDCQRCGERHVVADSNPPMLLFYVCGEKTCLAGLNGRSLVGVTADVSGEI